MYVHSRSVVSSSLDPMDCSLSGSSVHGDSPGENTRMDCLSLLQGIFPTQPLNPELLHCRQILYHLSHKGSPRIPEWVAYPFSRGSSQLRDQTLASRIAGGFFTFRATREAQNGCTWLLRLTAVIHTVRPWHNSGLWRVCQVTLVVSDSLQLYGL